MTKSDLVARIARKTGIEREVVLTAVEALMEEVKGAILSGEAVHLRGFGSFIVKHRAQKTGRLMPQNTPIIIPAHDHPGFKPAEQWVERMKKRDTPPA